MPQQSARVETERFVTATGFAPSESWEQIADAFADQKTGAVNVPLEKEPPEAPIPR